MCDSKRITLVITVVKVVGILQPLSPLSGLRAKRVTEFAAQCCSEARAQLDHRVHITG